MLVLAHRGLHHRHPENTMAAFAAAVDAGVDGIETDVRLTRDGVAVLFHDPSIRRKKVAALTHAELSRLAHHHVPTLEEALAKFDVLWDVEIKSRDAVDATVAVLRRFAGRRRFFVTSFQPRILTRVTDALDVDVGRIFSRRPLRGRKRPGPIIVIKKSLATRLRLRVLHLEKRRVHVYDARTVADHARLAALGVEAVITDWPERARR